MTETRTAEPGAPAAAAMSLPARVFGVIFSPRATYASVAAHPRWFGIFLTVFLVSATAATALMSTEIGRNAVLDQQIASAEAYGRTMPQAQIDQLEKMSQYYVYFAPVLQLVAFSLGGLLIAGIVFAVFNALLGGDASFKQVFAIVAHSGVILAALSLFTTPLAYARESLSSATNLGVFLPFLDDTSFVARLLGSIDLIYLWWMLSLSIGLGVLYRKRTGPIATTMIIVYVVIGVIIAAIKTASTGV
jgi:hypothetical protein